MRAKPILMILAVAIACFCSWGIGYRQGHKTTKLNLDAIVVRAAEVGYRANTAGMTLDEACMTSFRVADAALH